MRSRARCPEKSSLEALLAGALPEAEQARIVQHLDDCRVCRERLEQLAPDLDDVLGGSASRVDWEESPPDSILQAAIDRLTCEDEPSHDMENKPSAGEKQSLDFLDASHNPRYLGRLGAYEIIEVVGRGGMGIVLKGHDPSLNRFVAIKVLAPQLASDAAARKRFRREGQAAAAVSHDHVVTIHAVDEQQGMPYLVMEFVSGQSLEDRINCDGTLELKEILRVGAQAASGLAAAHAQGLVHRDIKPANILLENGVERVKITDFGLARAVDDVRITHPNIVAGTPQYMSPEQAQGHAVDHRADLFSLGGVLYTMCTGRAPFRAENTAAMIHRVCDHSPRPIRDVNPEIPPWFVDVIECLLAKDPDARVQSAREVAELLSSYLAYLQEPTAIPEPVRPAIQSDMVSPLQRPITGRRVWLTAAAVVFIAVTLGFTEVNGLTDMAGTVIRVVRGDGTLVIEVDDPEIDVLVDGQEVVLAGAGPKAIRLRVGQHELKASNDGHAIQTKLINITRGAKRVVRISLAGKQSQSVTTPSVVTDQSSEGAVLRRVWAGEDVDLHGSITSDGRYLTFVDWDTQDLALRDLTTGTNRRLTRKAPQSYEQADFSIFSPDNQQIAYSWLNDQFEFELRVGRVDEAQHRLLYREDSSSVRPIDWSPDGTRILAIFEKRDAAAEIGWVSTFDGTAQILKTFDGGRPARALRAFSLSPDGRHVAYHLPTSTDSHNRDIFLLSADGSSEAALVQHAADDRVLGWTPGGSGMLFSSDRRGSVDAWLLQVKSGQPQGEPRLVKTDVGNIEPLGFAQDGSFYFGLEIGGFDVHIAEIAGRVGEAPPKPQLATAYFEGTNSRPGWSRDGRFLAFISTRHKSNVLCILSAETGQQKEFPLLSNSYRSSGVCWSPNGKYILVEQRGENGRGIYQVDASSGELTALVKSDRGRVYQPQWAPDGDALFYVRADAGKHHIVRHELTTGKHTKVYSSSPFINSLTLSRDGQTLAFNFGDGTAPASIKVVPARGGEIKTLLELEPGDVGGAVGWTPEGGHLIVKRHGEDAEKRELWQVAVEGGKAEKLPVAMARIFSLCVHPNGQRIAFHGGEPARGEVWVMENLQMTDP